MIMTHYQTNLTDKEWEILGPYFAPNKLGRPRKHNIRDVINAIRYVMKTGCQWRMLPNDFPNHKVVYDYYMRWKQSGKIQKIHDALVQEVRISSGKNPNPTVGIIDAQSAATTSNGDERGYDAGKKNQRQKASYNS